MAQHVSSVAETRVEDLPPRGGEQKRVVVVGAGAAGLAAAYQLRRAGHDVVVLEARTRPGGRVHSVRRDFADGLHAEAGAVFIAADHDHLMKYVRLVGLAGELLPVKPGHMGGFCYLQGRRYFDEEPQPLLWQEDDSLVPSEWPGDLAEDEKKARVDDLFERYVGRLEGGLGDPESPDWPAHLGPLDHQTVVELLESLGATPAAAELIRATRFIDYGDNGRTVSPLYILQQMADSRRLGTRSTWHTIKGGNDRWLVGLAAMLKEQIHYGSEVVGIEHHDSGVSVAVQRNGKQSAVAADYVICALPFAVLRHIAISPGLSAIKRRVVEELQSTQISHLYIQCERRVWRRQDGRGVIAINTTDTELAGILRDSTFNQPGPRGILDLYMIGPQAERMDGLAEEERLPLALAELEKIFPGIPEVAEGSAYHSWNLDPFSRGDYVNYLPGQFDELWPHVATPEGRIHFAGDQTSNKSTWQTGAIASGHRAASEVDAA